MKPDDILKAHKMCWEPGEAIDAPIICDDCPYKQYGGECVRRLCADTIECLEEFKALDRKEIYLEVQHEYLLEDARNFVTDFLAREKDCDPDDITDEELDKYDYEFLVEQYEHYQNCNVAFNSTWESVVADYMSDLEEDYEEEDDDD